MDELCYLSAGELGVLLRRREVSAAELAGAMLARIERLDPKVNAYITVATEEALAAARQCDAALAAGREPGPLHGIPLAVKDLFDTAGVRTTSGSRILATRVPERDATAVAKLRAAGAVILGKTNLNEFAAGVTTTNPHYGDTQNPWDLSRTPGGSSGGSGAALAAGLCTLATGTDTGGSIRIPAALCGIVGLKPSFGRISCHGVMPLSWEQDHAGPMGRTVHDVALMLEVMAGWDAADPAAVRRPATSTLSRLDGGIKGLRIGVDREYALTGTSAEVAAAFAAALEILAGLGARVVEVEVPGLAEAAGAALKIFGAEALAIHGEWLRTCPDDYDPLVRARLETGLKVSGADYAQAQRRRRELQRDLQVLFDRVDLLATPGCAVAAPPKGAKTVPTGGAGGGEVEVLAALTRFSRVFNLTGLPALSLPCGCTADGLPIGLQLAGAMFKEATVLRAAHAYERATAWHLRRPPLS